MIKVFENHMREILLVVLALAFSIWTGYAITIGSAQTERMVLACIEAGNQVIDGHCVK